MSLDLDEDDADGSHESFRAQMIDFHHSIGKWIIATLLILNGAPLFALLSKDSIPDGLLHAVAWPMVLGVAAALLCAAYSWLNAALVACLYPEFLRLIGCGKDSRLRYSLLVVVPIVQFVSGTASLVLFGLGVFQGMSALEQPHRPAASAVMDGDKRRS